MKERMESEVSGEEFKAEQFAEYNVAGKSPEELAELAKKIGDEVVRLKYEADFAQQNGKPELAVALRNRSERLLAKQREFLREIAKFKE